VTRSGSSTPAAMSSRDQAGVHKTRRPCPDVSQPSTCGRDDATCGGVDSLSGGGSGAVRGGGRGAVRAGGGVGVVVGES
jgi:hypothetical protein